MNKLEIANFIVNGLSLYFVIGVVFALWFVFWAIRNVNIEGRGIILRVMLIPASVLLWPFLIMKSVKP